MAARLQGKRAFIVGAGQGIGRAIAAGFASEDARVVCASRGPGIHDVAAQIVADGGDARSLTVDIGDRAEVLAAVGRAEEWLGGLDVVVQSAGVSMTTPALEISEGEWRQVLSTNLDGSFHLAQAAAQKMVARGSGGSLVLVSSQLSQVAIPNKLHYLASKGGLEMLTRGLALELAVHGVRVNSLAPGVTRTRMALGRLEDDDAAMQRTLERIPLGRLADPEEMVGPAIFLASDDASYMTGATLVVDGGYLAA